MSIVKITKRDCPYVQIDHRPLNDSRLSWRARGLLAYLLSKPADWEVVIAALVNESPGGEDTVRGALKELEVNGYAKLETLRCGKGRVAGKRWIILEVSTDMPIYPTSGFTSSGKSGTTKDREIQKKDSVKGEAVTIDIPLLLNTPEFTQAWAEWLAYLKDRRMTPTARVIELHMATCEQYGVDIAVAAIKHSIECQYRKPFPPPAGKFRNDKPVKPAADYSNNGGWGETR